MALFSSKKNTETTEKATPKAVKKVAAKKTTKAAPKTKEVAVVAPTESTVVSAPSARSLSHIIVRPRITEKASMQAENGTYAFEVATSADKRSVAAAVRAMYNVTPIKVAIVRIPAKNVMIRNRPGVKKGGKKAYVYLKKGDKIEFV